MKSIAIVLTALALLATGAFALELRPTGPGTSEEDALRFKEDYLEVRAHCIDEYLRTGAVGDHSYRSLSMLVGFAETRGYVFRPRLRVTEKPNIGGAVLIQILEDPNYRFDYPGIYKLRLGRTPQ